MRKLLIIILLIGLIVCAGSGHFKGKKASSTYYVVTGTSNPDATGNYFYYAEYDGKPYYRRVSDPHFAIWWYSGIWAISTNAGEHSIGYWYSEGGNIIGTYDFDAPYSGNPIVSLGQ